MWNVLVTVCRGLWMELGSGGKGGKWTAAVWCGDKDAEFGNSSTPSHLTHLRLLREWRTGLVGAGFSAPGAIP